MTQKLRKSILKTPWKVTFQGVLVRCSFLFCLIINSFTSYSQTIIYENNFTDVSSLKMFGSVDYSTNDKPGWWNKYCDVLGNDSTPLIGLSYKADNPEYVLIDLRKMLKNGVNYRLTLEVKGLCSATSRPEHVDICFVKRKPRKVAKTRLENVAWMDVSNIQSDWSLISTVISGRNTKKLLLGNVLLGLNSLPENASNGYLLINRISIEIL